MKKIYISLILLTFSFIASLANATLEQADSAYTHDDFAKAVNLYEQVITDEGTSSSLYYNLGNAYYRLGKLGKAIVCYERAIILDPRNEDAHINLRFVNTKITDKPGDNGTFISNTLNAVTGYYHSNTWASFALISFVLMLCAVALYIFSSRIFLKKLGFFGGLFLLFVMILALVSAFHSATNANNHNKAIVIEPSTILSTSPRTPKDRSEEALLLHEGTKVEILDSVTDGNAFKWYDVKVDNNNRAWIKSSSIEII